jgi:hypothetical protein
MFQRENRLSYDQNLWLFEGHLRYCGLFCATAFTLTQLWHFLQVSSSSTVGLGSQRILFFHFANSCTACSIEFDSKD